jgi:hypothetical protein
VEVIVFSIDLITADNGWAMPFAGALIVMCGLTALSFVISQLHKLVTFFDKKEAPEPETISAAMLVPPESTHFDPGDIDATETCYRALVKDLGDTFELNALYKAATRQDLPHPHLSVRSLREAGVITPRGQGMFGWH